MTYPTKYYITSGKGTSKHQLVAFDNALLDAGISNYNLLKVSSILPESCTQQDNVDVRKGSALLTAFASVSSDHPSERIATAVAVGIPKDRNQIGVIMECKGITSAETEQRAREMVTEAMENHGIELEEIKSSSIEGVVEEGFLSLVSAIAMW